MKLLDFLFSLGYMTYVEKYLETVLTKVKPYLRGNGGPIIMVQVSSYYLLSISNTRDVKKYKNIEI